PYWGSVGRTRPDIGTYRGSMGSERPDMGTYRGQTCTALHQLPRVPSNADPSRFTALVSKLVRAVLPAGAAVPIPSSGDGRGGEGDGEPFAPEHHAVVPREIDTGRHRVVLVSEVALEPAQLDIVGAEGMQAGVGGFLREVITCRLRLHLAGASMSGPGDRRELAGSGARGGPKLLRPLRGSIQLTGSRHP
ncbi:MAG TPA: hypothetical protein VFO16_10810, partial [Pseudonocardiaceae bacterium]|nr:hypothetical protein [Pseudonocardiaceae bacterium]